MAQKFFDVFKGLNLSQELSGMLADVEVTKITKTSANDVYRFYIQSDRLILKENIFKIESAIRKQIFAKTDTKPRLVEKYNLSKQYDVKKLWDIYFDSLLLEYKDKDVIVFSMLKNAAYEFTDETHMTIRLPESIISDAYAQKVKEEIER
ncbi:MAG: hypothetical protein NC086_07120, partial [Alistipes sp.]|nr:hypothetical protein [Alistipes sp.]